MACGDVLSLEDLQTAKKHQLFEAEVITGKAGGVAGGASIDYATNQVTGQTQKTLPAVLRDAGFRPAPFTFVTGGTLAIGDSDMAVLWPVSGGGDGQYYIWKGAYPKVIPAASSPATTGGVSDAGWLPLGDITLRGDLASVNSTVSIAGVTAERVADAANGEFGPVKLQQGIGSNLLIRDVTPGNATRAHIEPNGRIQTGTTSKLDWMFDPYQDDGANYRIFNIYNEVGSLPNLRGENGRSVLNVKGTGQQWGVWPSLHIGFQDGAKVPLKIFYFDTSDTAWRTPQRGLWHSGTQYSVDDYVLSDFKLYKATTAGISGGLPPVHASGSVSDGVVTWLFVRNYQASVNAIEACTLFGQVEDMPLFGHPGICAQFHRHTLYKNGFRQKFLKADGSLMAWSGVAVGSDSYQIEMSDGSRTQFFDGWRRSSLSALSLGVQVINSNSSTVDVATKEMVTFSNTAPTTVTAFSNARANQSFYVEATNSNTTIAHNSAIRLRGAANINLTVETILHFVRHSDGRFVQI
jgi:hypothetical protein